MALANRPLGAPAETAADQRQRSPNADVTDFVACQPTVEGSVRQTDSTPWNHIALRETDEGFSVSVPGLPGCWSQGATEAEALQNIHDAIQAYLSTRDELLEGTVVREVEVAS